MPSSKEDLISGGESVYLFLGPLTLDEILDVILDPAGMSFFLLRSITSLFLSVCLGLVCRLGTTCQEY